MNTDGTHITVIPTGSSHESSKRQFLLFCLSIREQVFCEEQQVAFHVEQDGKDNESGHILLWIHDVPVGTLRFRKTTEGIKLERVSVLKEYRGLHYGILLIRAGIKAAREEGATGPVYLHAQKSAQGFYEKIGFVSSLDEFIEGGIAHTSMALPSDVEISMICQAYADNPTESVI
ncbi:MAG: GNAT family N-acetyltransferase [Sphaerochaetaceae bacterium]|jgi:predicted GNAT family N-acyltransferase|nr:GNAT family N-acetyltransferase [Sphaerochaetaceae bacterium]MDD3671158.1 GNAT family N-acetyltransferase [Sphaerochaetaceae bacterium]MDD4258629.1 GNAT family N-acetyltransferase [Sphaerochaetaceae bacterium]MDX9933744.1 GNAT family N-acetyltransferase [Sphaerochaetaceae bacterium]